MTLILWLFYSAFDQTRLETVGDRGTRAGSLSTAGRALGSRRNSSIEDKGTDTAVLTTVCVGRPESYWCHVSVGLLGGGRPLFTFSKINSVKVFTFLRFCV